jgi:L-asparaginase/Glu-tRNA(Gln) amidotransferase subunit D
MNRHVMRAAAAAAGIVLGVHLPAAAQTKPRIKFVTTGGTIAHLTKPDGSSGRLTIAEVMRDIRSRYPQPSVAAILDSIDFQAVEVTRVGSSTFSSKEFLEICAEAQKGVTDGFDAIIVTHGTVMSEDTVYFLNLLVGGDVPIVLVNSQIQHMAVGNDGDLNLLNAIMVASARSSRSKTVLVENQKIMPAREVLKGSDLPGGFSAGALGPLGWVRRPGEGYTAANADEFVAYYRQPTRNGRATSEFGIKDLTNADGSFKPLPRVEVLAGHYDGQIDLVDAAVKLGVEGFVVTGLPPSGRGWGPQAEHLEELAKKGMPIVHTSRNAAQYQNRVNPSGSLTIEGDNLPWQKARILLQLAMLKTASLQGAARLAEIQRLIDTH